MSDGVGDDAGVQDRVVGQRAVGAQPHPLASAAAVPAPVERVAVDVAHVDRAGPVVPLADSVSVRAPCAA